MQLWYRGSPAADGMDPHIMEFIWDYMNDTKSTYDLCFYKASFGQRELSPGTRNLRRDPVSESFHSHRRNQRNILPTNLALPGR